METFFIDTKVFNISVDAPIVAVKPNELGYWPVQTEISADDLNKGAPHDVLESAYVASMFGWNCPAAKKAAEYAG